MEMSVTLLPQWEETLCIKMAMFFHDTAIFAAENESFVLIFFSDKWNGWTIQGYSSSHIKKNSYGSFVLDSLWTGIYLLHGMPVADHV